MEENVMDRDSYVDTSILKVLICDELKNVMGIVKLVIVMSK